MSAKNKKIEGGINITGGQVSVSGDMVGRDKITTSTVVNNQLTEIFQQFYQAIQNRPEQPGLPKEKLVEAVQEIEKEVSLGEQASLSKVQKWFEFLASMADDIFTIVTTTLSNPIAGISKAIQLIAQKARQEAGKAF